MFEFMGSRRKTLYEFLRRFDGHGHGMQPVPDMKSKSMLGELNLRSEISIWPRYMANELAKPLRTCLGQGLVVVLLQTDHNMTS